MPESLMEIGQGAFEDCVSLESVTVPENVTVLNENVFFGCDSLKEVKMTGKVTKSLKWLLVIATNWNLLLFLQV